MIVDLAILKDFSIEDARAIIWVFKKSTTPGEPPAPVFTGRWIPSDAALGDALIEAFDVARNSIDEVFDYSILEQNNEASVLRLESLETHADSIIDSITDELDFKKAKKTKELQNAFFYVVKIINDDGAVYCFRKCDGSWSAKKSGGFLFATYKDDMLSLEVEPKFNVSKAFDFFVINGTIFAKNKSAFESILSYKQGHVDDFSTLCEEPEFNAVFSGFEPIAEYVGNNAMQLRRMSAIKQKGHYKNPDFLVSLKLNYVAYGLRLEYDDNGKIVPTIETCPDIFQALLDHRLKSHHQTLYDVQSAIAIV